MVQRNNFRVSEIIQLIENKGLFEALVFASHME